MHPRIIASGLLLAGSVLTLTSVPARSAPEPLLPDLTTLSSYMQQYRVRRKGRSMLLYFPAAIYNVGRGPLEMLGSRDSRDTEMQGTQVIYDSEGGQQTLDLGGWEYHTPHRHWHVLDVAAYRLRNSLGQEVGSTPKVSYFLEDTRWIDRTLPGAPLTKQYRFRGRDRKRTARSLRTGISVGWADVYDTSVPGQYIDVTGLPAGQYTLEVEVNPERTLIESNYANNVVSVPVQL